MDHSLFKLSKRGYTTIELIIGMVVLLAFGIITLIIVNPHQLVLEGRDAQRKKEVIVLGEALISFAKSKNGVIPQSTGLWLSDLEGRGEIKSLPEIIPYDASAAICKVNQQSQYCYTTDGRRPSNSAIVYTKLESTKENNKCNASLGETAYAVYDMLSVRGGVVCTIGVEPVFSTEGQRFLD